MAVEPLNIRGRKEAQALGLKRFFTGKPCKHGHVAERCVGTYACMECNRGRWRMWQAANPQKARDNRRLYYAKNKDRILDKLAAKQAANKDKANIQGGAARVNPSRPLIMTPSATMDGTAYRAACEKLAISVYKSAEELGISLRSAQRYAAGESPIPERVAKLLRVLIQLSERAANKDKINKRRAARRRAARAARELNGAGLTGS
jgi:hypothetical protein